MRSPIIATTILACLIAALARGQDEAQDARVQQYVQLLTPAMWRELDFVRQVCDLAPEQRPKIKAAADTAVKETAKNMLKPQGAHLPTAAAQKIRDSVRETLKKTLTSEQLERYDQEDAVRSEATKRAAIISAVAQFDGALFFKPDQRDKIIKALEDHWQREWEHWLTMRQYGEQYYPQVPDEHIVPHLTDEQKTVWNGLQRVMIYGWNHNPRQQNDDAWWNPQPAKNAKAKGKATPAKGKAGLLHPAKKTN